MEVSIPVITGYTVEDYGDANPGDILTPDTDIPPVPICTMPDSEEVDEMVRDAVGGFVAGLLDVERLELLDIKIETVENDFNTLTALSMFYEPKPVLGVAQPAVDLGEAGSETGLGTTITLEPPQPVDFLELIEDNESNPWPDCPTLDVQMTGTVPAMSPRWDVSVRLRMEGHISL
ncbi:MAG: hypothetical protein NTZ09_15530 [Candidatus Hydrogenedentes bacterium]|nr:hypothetical protein [Candidatus Hydrogenedentota bacterium]